MADRTAPSSPLSASPRTTVHVLGLGAVGRAFLKHLDRDDFQVLAVTDSTGTLPALDTRRLATALRTKEAGGSLCALPGCAPIDSSLAARLVGADIVVDCTSSDPERAEEGAARIQALLGRGCHVVLAEKEALALAGDRLLEAHPSRLHLDAVLGGTGHALQSARTELRACDTVRLVANASTSALLDRVGAGADWPDAIREVQRLGILEADPTRDLSGEDAWVKARIVARVLWCQALPEAPAFSLTALDAHTLRRSAAEGGVCRLVATVRRDGRHRLALEWFPRHHPLAVPPTRVAYAYQVGRVLRHLHVGAGLGPEGTARALLSDAARVHAASHAPALACAR